MKWFLRKSSTESLAISMAGVKLGDRLLFLGCSDPLLIAQLAVKTGLTGRAFVADERESLLTAASEVAAREGALIETATSPWNALPLENNAFDVAVVRDVLPQLAPERRGECLREVQRVLRPGGRCLVVDGRAQTGISALVRGGHHAIDYGAEGLVPIFTAQGFKAGRILAEREGLLFAEAVKPAGS